MTNSAQRAELVKMGEKVFGELSLMIINALGKTLKKKQKKKLLVKTKLVEEAFLWEKFLGGESKKKKNL